MIENLKKNAKGKDWWSKINWTSTNVEIRKIQNEIYLATKRGNYNRAKNLMKSLVKCDSAKLLAIYIITQKNRGRNTPGIDGKTYLTLKERKNLINSNFSYSNYKFKPVIKIDIPKNKHIKKNNHSQGKGSISISKQKYRTLGIMTMKDRVMAKILSFALNAKWEAFFESNVMGFRPGRSRQDALFRICNILSRGNHFILDADIENFFDNITHKIILSNMNIFKRIIKKLLKIKIIKNGKPYKNKRGIIQGNPLSPVLANIALHGMQQIFETPFHKNKKYGSTNRIRCIRYADDFIVIAPSIKIIKTTVFPKLEQFLDKRGLSLNKEKTNIISLEQGFSFLGYSIKQCENQLIVHCNDKSFKKTIIIS